MELKQVLSTKTLDDKALMLAHSLGMSITCIDFIQINGLTFDLSLPNGQSPDAIVFTSANAVKYFFENEAARGFIKGKTIFSLSEKTSSELLTHGIHADYVKKNAGELARAIARVNGIKSVLHVCGNRRLDILEEQLNTAGINYASLFVYKTKLKSMALNKIFDAILFYSPSGIEGFFAANHAGDKTVFCCIGETTSDELKKRIKNPTVIVPQAPAPETMISSLGEYYRNKQAAK